MKKIFSLFLIVSLILPFTHVAANQEDDNYFVVTAYYSPLPNQEYYITGNYEAELRLNGRGIAGASGKGVFSGMLAAPGKYSFGTKIYLEGLGIGAVEDRGGAIVPAGERGYSYDRIDVWMGYGDEGLLRANFWGKRKVYGYVVDAGNATTINYKDLPAPSWATTGLQKTGFKGVVTQQAIQEDITNVEQNNETLEIFTQSLGVGSDPEAVSQLQDILIELGYSNEFSGQYDDTMISVIYDFQVEHGILASENDLGAGYFGPKTRAKLQETYETHISEENRQEQLLEQISDIKTKSQQKAEEYIENLDSPKYGEVSYEVRELQKILQQLEYFDNKDTAIFGNITKNAITQYQLDMEIIDSINDAGAGVFGPKTQESITQKFFEMYFQEYLIENELLDFYNDTI